jgi:hypothetical protein
MTWIVFATNAIWLVAMVVMIRISFRSGKRQPIKS